MSDSAAAMIGAAVGTSTTTSYIEAPRASIRAAAPGSPRFTVAVLFLLALFVAPLAARFRPTQRRRAALRRLPDDARAGRVEWDDITEAAPAVITAIAMPFTFSIAEGIAFGFIAYTVIKLVAGKFSEIHPAVGILAVLFVIKYVFIG
jgi:AGZA family xanthine/uracil permease-like MFS transporter